MSGEEPTPEMMGTQDSHDEPDVKEVGQDG